MKKLSLSLLFLNTTLLLAVGDSVVPHDKDYYTYEKDNIEIIYTKDNLPFAKHTASIEEPLNSDYEKFFDWEFDETLYVGLISCHNQVANGFSTQWPNNRQINYMGGAQIVDYFSTTSWLDTLLYHETAHNYQVNVKGSAISRGIHSIFGNGFVLFPMPLSVPNVMENSFMLEGNAVLNESWHGNGGRLYSGRFKAQTILQAKAGNIVASDVYNSKLAFPYGEIVYIQGGFYNLYLAQKYGMKSVNSYFKNHSVDFWWPQFTNASMEESVGVDFEDSLNDFAKEYTTLAENFVEVEGKSLASSQFFSPLSSSGDEIFFITNESGVESPELIVVNKKSLEIKKAKDSWTSGKVIKVDDEYYTQGSRHTSPIRITQGLFCNQGFIKDGTASRMIQGYLSDKRAVYFDMTSSFSEPQLYIGDEFYSKVNSSVIVDRDDNLYYFKQDKKTRTLYKNKTPLYSYEGFYGVVSDVDSKGIVYFVANSELGSTLYSFNKGVVTRASLADNIIEARLVDDTKVLLASISDKEYYYVFNDIKSIDKEPYETKLFFEDKEYYGEYKNRKSFEDINLSDSYYSMLDMHYSGTDLGLGYNSKHGITGNFSINFGDPLSQNALSAFINRNDSNETIAGLSYSNSQYLLNYTLVGYGVVEDDDKDENRDYGLMINTSLPFYQAGYLYGALGLSYYQDYSTAEREPLSATLTLALNKTYGVSMYANYSNNLQLYGVSERGDNIVGAEYSFKHDLAYEFYFGLGVKYSQTDNDTGFEARGVKLTNNSYEEMDPSSINMPSLDGSVYIKDGAYGEVNLAKVFNFSSYFFTFPISLQRESFYTKYRHYNISSFSNKDYTADEITAGITLSTVFLNSLAMPISFEYIYNDADFIEDESFFRFIIGTTF